MSMDSVTVPLPVPPFIRMPELLVGVTSPLAPEKRVTVALMVSPDEAKARVLVPDVMALTVLRSVRLRSFRVTQLPGHSCGPQWLRCCRLSPWH